MKLACSVTAVNSSGDLLYCNTRGDKIFQDLKHLIFSGQIKCCFENHSCVEDWATMQSRIYKTAKWDHIPIPILDIRNCAPEFTNYLTNDYLKNLSVNTAAKDGCEIFAIQIKHITHLIAWKNKHMLYFKNLAIREVIKNGLFTVRIYKGPNRSKIVHFKLC